MGLKNMGAMSPALPPVDSDQLLPTIFENRARTDPHGIWAKFPVSPTTYESGFRTATHLEVTNAINKVAWLLDEHFGKSKDFETLAYLGPNDLRYTIVVIAGIKAGYKTFLPSPRNSKAGHISLLSRLQCQIMVTTAPELPCVPTILKEYSMRKLQIPSLPELLDSHDTPNYPYEKRFEEAKNDQIFVLHTSGSTGIPKPLVYTNNLVTRIANVTSLPSPEGFWSPDRYFRTGNFFSLLPAFHVAGIGFSLIVPAFNGSIPIYPLPGMPPTSNGFLEAIKNTDVDWAFLLPVIIDELSKDAASLDLVASKLNHLFYTGGSLPRSSGDIVSSRIPLYQVMGSSECATFPLLRLENDQMSQSWNYIQVHPSVQAEFRHRFEDLYELVVVKEPDFELYQPVFLHFPELKEYETRDLFSPHPTRPGLWTHRSRIDDVIVFINGEKTNPVSFEEEISRHPEVRAALVAGQQRFEASLLVELVDDMVLSSDDKSRAVERLWPAVQEANSQCPAHAKVSKSKILFVDPSMPMPRAGKGTVQRQATWNLYSNQLDDLYNEINSDASGIQPGCTDLANKDSVTQAIHQLVADVTEWKQFDDGDEFFSLGMDSLQVLRLRRELKLRFGLASTTSTTTIYENPSVDLLTKEIMRAASQDHISVDDSEKVRLGTMAALLQKYLNHVDELATATLNGSTPTIRLPSTSHVILLTGSTGAVGSYILQELLLKESVAHVYCLNRAVDSQLIQTARNAKRCIPTDFSPGRVTFLTADLSKSDFRLDTSVYSKILSTTTQVIHNAWPVDFNRTLQSFQKSLDGVLNLISFAAKAHLSPSVFFLSSISSVINYHNTSNAEPLIPEAVITDLSCAAPMGYGESKYLAERILDYAAHKLHLNTGTVRIGQIAGTANEPHGWNRNEWLPSLVVSSRYIGAIPESLGSNGSGDQCGMMDEIDWVPIDQLAKILVELAFALHREAGSLNFRVFHATHPHPTSWHSLLPTVMESLNGTFPSQSGAATAKIKTLPFQAWVDLLRSKSLGMADDDTSSVTPEAVQMNPGVKLLGFYERLLVSDQIGARIKMDTKRTLHVSKSLKNLQVLRPEWMAGWVKEWMSSPK